MEVTRHPIELESYRIISELVDLSTEPTLHADIIARVIHATADIEYAGTLRFDPGAADAGVNALRRGMPIICDTKMVTSGITGITGITGAKTHCLLQEIPSSPASSLGSGTTRSAAGMRAAAEQFPAGAIVVVGCAPTALEEIVRLAEQGIFSPQLVVGVPVGFVGAAEAKQRARDCDGLKTITNIGDKGGSAVAAAVMNALIRAACPSVLAPPPAGSKAPPVLRSIDTRREQP